MVSLKCNVVCAVSSRKKVRSRATRSGSEKKAYISKHRNGFGKPSGVMEGGEASRREENTIIELPCRWVRCGWSSASRERSSRYGDGGGREGMRNPLNLVDRIT